ncbi:MAG: sigma-70 family RNA polymerase sigma factor [Chloroflexi bacterium]|nr:sigma-70 family RNA polymerase sigma factor [Chloroflexota bacterium]
MNKRQTADDGNDFVIKQQVPTDTQLIEDCRHGRQEAWQQILTRYERLVFSIPLNYGLTRADAADVAQLTFTTLVEHLERLHPDSNLGGWLATVARRHSLHHLRRHKREFLGQDEDVAESHFLLNTPDSDATTYWERVNWLNQGLDLLDKRCRDLLLLLYFSEEQPAYEEVAEQLGLRVGSIGPIRGRCLERLRVILVEREE